MRITLPGPWWIERDPDNKGREQRWFARGPGPESVPAPVPGLIQQPFPTYNGLAWYWTSFDLPAASEPGERCLLRFGAVDYAAWVWVNGVAVGRHEGGESPFVFDVTDVLAPSGPNLLAVRVLNPTDQAVDGIVLNETPHRNRRSPYAIGWAFNRGGITASVEVALAPSVRITDIFARPDVHTGSIRASITVQNDRPGPGAGRLALTVAPATGGEAVTRGITQASLAPGANRLETEIRVEQPHLWDLDDPYLYRLVVDLSADDGSVHTGSVRCGFRELRVENGYFRLNGRRIFLRCSHTGNDWPSALSTPQGNALLRRDLLYAKAAGFNALRFIAGGATPEQLDACDELGLMVHEEALSSWCMEDSLWLGERFDRANEQMIRRDRNHPSVVIWGLLNETLDGPVFRHAVRTLPLVRALDETRLVFLNTGRMDCDLGIGSVSNPGSHVWEHVWGGEAQGAGRYENLKEPHTFGGYPGGYFERVGDAHMYPPTPHTAETIRFLRTLGHDTKPVYLGEYGIASTVNALRVTRLYEQNGYWPDVEDALYFRRWAEQFAADWQRFGMDDVAPFPEDVLRQANRIHGAQRLLALNAIRANPKICGYNLTGTVDQGMTAEGLWTTWREFKPGVLDALAEGLAPLRWCLFVEPLHGYRGQPFTLDVVLANEDVLAPGDYPVTVRVFGPQGTVLDRRLTLTIPAGEGPLALPVFSEQVIVDGAPGAYQLAVEMARGGAPTGGRAVFYLDDPIALPKISAGVTVWEEGERLDSWLTAQGIRSRSLADADGAADIVLVGDVGVVDADAGRWQALARRMAHGACAMFLTPSAFKRGDDPVGWLPLAEKGRCDLFYNSIYHREDVARPHPIFEGLPGPGIMDWTYYRDVIPDRIFQGQATPDEVIAAAFALGYTCPGGYTSGVVTGVYRFGAGRFLVNTLRLIENLGTHPVADRLLLNALAWASRTLSERPEGGLAGPALEARLVEIGYLDATGEPRP